MGKASRRKREQREEGYSAPDPEGLVKRLLMVDAPDPAPTADHYWVVAAVFELPGDDEMAHALARAQVDDPGWWRVLAPFDEAIDLEFLDVQGVYCGACGKRRGPDHETTKCGEAVPVWFQRQRAKRELEALGRGERRNLTHRMRREERKRRLQADIERVYGKALAVRPVLSDQDVKPITVDDYIETPIFADPELAMPEAAMAADPQAHMRHTGRAA